MLRIITQSQCLNLFSGLILLFTSLYETITTFEKASVGVHHGILVFSVIQIAKAVPEIMHALKQIQKADELRKEKIAAY